MARPVPRPAASASARPQPPTPIAATRTGVMRSSPDRSPRTAGTPAPRRPAARISGSLASDGGAQPRDVLRLGFPDRSPRTAGPQPRDVLRLGFPDRSPRTAGPQPRDVLRLALPRSLGPDGGEAAQVDIVVRQLRGVDGHAVADQIRDQLQLAIGLRVLRVATAVEADGGAYDPVLQIEAEELAALGPAAEHETVPPGRDADVFDHVLVLLRPVGMQVIVGLLAVQQ